MAETIDLTNRVAGDGTWLSYQHAEFRSNVDRWVFAEDYYSGRVLDNGKRTQYLLKRRRGEAEDAYKERADLADYTNHFGAVVDSIAGMLFAVEGDSNRTFGPLIGSPSESGTLMERLYAEGYMSVWKQLASELLVQHRCWVLVDAADGNPSIKLFPVTAVPNWLHGKFGLSAVVVKEQADLRSSIRDQPGLVDQWLVFEEGGWSRWGLDAQSQPTELERGSYSYRDRKGNPALPIYMVELPLNRMVGWQLARKAHAMFNMESTRDFLLRVANFPKLNLVAGDTLFDKLVTDLDRGSNVLQCDPNTTGGTTSSQHSYIAPPATSAEIASNVIQRKVEEFYISAFRMYGDSAKEKTATESRQDVSQGVGAFLQLLKAAVDDAENEALWRLEQSVDPRKRQQHFKSRVERSDDFVPSDVDRAIEKLRERYFGGTNTVPVGRSAMIAAAKTIAGWDGVVLDDKELESAIDARLLADAFTAVPGLEVPPEAMVQLVLKILVASGMLDPAATVDMEGGGSDTLAAVIEREVREAYEAKAEAGRREAEKF